MYTLYYIPGACSLATQVVIHELDQAVEIIDKQKVENFSAINPVGTVHIATSNSNNIINSRKFIIKEKGRDYIRKMASLEAINMLSLSIS